MSRVSHPSNENPEKKFFEKFQKKIFLKFFFQDFHYLDKKPLTWGVYIPFGKSQFQGFEKMYVGSLFSGYLKLGVLGAWMTFKKAETAKTLRNVLSMIKMNPLNHNWLDFVI